MGRLGILCVLMFSVMAPALALVPVARFDPSGDAPVTSSPASLDDSLSDLALPVGVVGEPDRRTESDFGRENGMTIEQLQTRYAANGKLLCDKSETNANLVLANDVIVTSAHAFYESKSCASVSTPGSCKFVVQIGKVVKETKVKGIEKMGFKCDRNPPVIPEPSDDWAVLKLDGEVRGVVPFQVSPTESISENQDVTSVSSINLDFFPKGKRSSPYVKTVGRCKARRVFTSFLGVQVWFSSDCDGTVGSSGGAVLKDDRDVPILLGIKKSGDETSQELHAAVARKSPNQREYSEGSWAMYNVPVRGDFLRAILSAVR